MLRVETAVGGSRSAIGFSSRDRLNYKFPASTGWGWRFQLWMYSTSGLHGDAISRELSET